jgi:protease I
MKALFISADGFEDLELLVPWYRLQEAGIEVDVASPQQDRITGLRGYEVDVNKRLDSVDPDEYGLLVLPGGKAPQRVRRESAALEIVRSFFEQKKPVAAICHGPQILISAGVIRGRRATCYKEVETELREVGARYEDSQVVVDGNLVTSRQPSDLSAFMRETIRLAGI